MKLKNKWNGKVYILVKKSADEATLKRQDGSEFTISAKELAVNYYEIKEKSVDNIK